MASHGRTAEVLAGAGAAGSAEARQAQCFAVRARARTFALREIRTDAVRTPLRGYADCSTFIRIAFEARFAATALLVGEIAHLARGTVAGKGQPLFKVTPDEIVVEEDPKAKAARIQVKTESYLRRLLT